MSVEVRIPTPFRELTGGAAMVACDGATIREVIDHLIAQHEPLAARLRDDAGALPRYINVYINEENIRALDQLDTAVKDGDVVAIFPAIAGGETGYVTSVRLTRVLLDKVRAHALEGDPWECCGILSGAPDAESEAFTFHSMRNAQHDHHVDEPHLYAQDADEAYMMDPIELLHLLVELGRDGSEVRVIYHSHSGPTAHFSAADVELAMAGSTPLFPKAVYLVLATDGESILDTRAYTWCPRCRQHEEVELQIV